jgi:hypothetical protein
LCSGNEGLVSVQPLSPLRFIFFLSF